MQSSVLFLSGFIDIVGISLLGPLFTHLFIAIGVTPFDAGIAGIHLLLLLLLLLLFLYLSFAMNTRACIAIIRYKFS